MAAQAEEAANLEDAKQDARLVMSDDKVIDRSNLFILAIHDVAAEQFAGPVALRNGTDINDDEFDMCTVTRAGDQAATYAFSSLLGRTIFIAG
jgi:hypothetical protein